jgi:HEAT repeat protein
VVHRRAWWVPAALALTIAAGPAHAAEGLASEDDDAAIAAARKLGDSGGTVALAALGKGKDPKVVPVLMLYAGNINLPVRLAAVKALGQHGDPKVIDLLLERLGDSQPQVRAAAGDALAARKVARAEKRLFLLVARNDAAAAGPLGTLMSPSAIPQLSELHGRIDDNVLATALGEFLKRPEVPDRLRVDVVKTVGRLPGAVATAALVEYLASIPDKDRRPSKDEAQRMLDQRGSK